MHASLATLTRRLPLCPCLPLLSQEERRASLGRYTAAAAPPASRVRAPAWQLLLRCECVRSRSAARVAPPAGAQAQAEVDSAIDSRLTALLG